jgi:hypothetical protein
VREVAIVVVGAEKEILEKEAKALRLHKGEEERHFVA